MEESRLYGLLKELESFVGEGLHIGWGNKVVLDELKIYQFIDAIREAVPGEVQRAKDVLARKQEILDEAREEARVRGEGLQSLVVEPGTSSGSNQRVNRMLEQARREADWIREEADTYVRDSLEGLEKKLNRLQREVRNGLDHLDAGDHREQAS